MIFILVHYMLMMIFILVHYMLILCTRTGGPYLDTSFKAGVESSWLEFLLKIQRYFKVYTTFLEQRLSVFCEPTLLGVKNWLNFCRNIHMVNFPKISNTKISDKMPYANSADPDQTAPEGAV